MTVFGQSEIILDAMSYYNLGFSLELIKCAKYVDLKKLKMQIQK